MVFRVSLGNAICCGLTLLVNIPAQGLETDVAKAPVSADVLISGGLQITVTEAWQSRQRMTQQLRRNLAACYDDIPLSVQLSTQTIEAAREFNDVTILAIATMQRSAANLRHSGFDNCRMDFEQAIQFQVSPDEPELLLLFQIARTMVEQSVYRGTDCLDQLEAAIASAEGTAAADVLELARFELARRTQPSRKHARSTDPATWTLAAISSVGDVRITEMARLRSLIPSMNLTNEQTAESEAHEAEILALPERLRRCGASRHFRAEAEFMAAAVYEHRAQHDSAIAALNDARQLLLDAGDLSLLVQADIRIAGLEHGYGNDSRAQTSLLSAAGMIDLINQPLALTQMARTGSQIPDFAARRFQDGSGLSTMIHSRLAHVQNHARWLRASVRSSKSLQLQALLRQTESHGTVLTTERDSAVEQSEFYLWLTGIGLLVSCGLAAFLLRERGRLRKLNERLRVEIQARETAFQDRERMELHLAQSARLDSLGDLAGGIAHDFNNLLVGVLGNAELLRFSRQISGDATEYLDGITHSAERAAELSRKMLAYAGKQPAQKTAVELNRVVQLMLPLFRHGSGFRHDVEFIPAAHPVYTEADEGQLEQVLLNLVTNSSHAMQQGTITIRVGVETLEKISGDPTLFGNRKIGGDFAWFEISDSGDGIAEADLARVFEPFYSTRSKETSHGFGLAVVYGHVNRHNGLIRLTSQRGVGTTFRILLPRQSEFHAPPLRFSGIDGGDHAMPKALSVVIVDDQVQVLEVVERMLQPNGWTVHCFTSVCAAMEFLSELPVVNCIVIDLMMPGVDGMSMLEELEQRGIDIPVIVMSGYSSTDIDDLRRFSAVTSFLQKPFKPEQLQQAISAAVDPSAVPRE